MKVLYLITKSERGGAQSHVWTLIERQRFATPVLAVGEDGFLGDQARAAGIPVRVIPDFVHPISPRRDFRALRELIRVIREEQPDLVHAHTAKAGMLARCAALATGIPAIYTVHAWSFSGMDSAMMRSAAVWIERALGLTGQSVIEVSRFNHEMAVRERVAPSRNHFLIWNGIPDSPWRASHSREDGPVKIIMVARFAPPKDHCLLLQALAGIKGDWECVFVGDGPAQPDARRTALDLGIAARIRFLGNRDDVAELLAASDLFVLCSNSESLPISILEAMRGGLPVVCSGVGGCSELVTHGLTGLLAAPGDADDLHRHLAALIRDRSLRESFGREGRKRFEAHFRVEQMISRTFEAYSQVLRAGVHESQIDPARRPELLDSVFPR